MLAGMVKNSIPDKQTRIESLLLQVIEENRELRRRLDSQHSQPQAPVVGGLVDGPLGRSDLAEGVSVQNAGQPFVWEFPGSELGKKGFGG